MNASCLSHCLTDAEREEFEERGYLVFEAVLSSPTVTNLIAVSDRLDAQLRCERGVGPHERMTVRDVLWRDAALLDLIDCPTVFPKVWGVLGWNIQIYHSVLAYSPPPPPGTDAVQIQGWHQDSGQLNADLELHPRPRISVKVGFFLSDCSQPGRANLWVVPGSHRREEIRIPDGTQPNGAEPVLCPAGGAVLFDRRIWHTASSNTCDVTRKVLLYGYSYRWLRPRDDQSVEHLYERCDPIRRQLLGASPTGGFGYTSPTDEDVPLRGWLREHLGEPAEPA